MKVLFISNTYTPYTSGVVRSIHTTITHLQRLGHEILLVTLDFKMSANDPSWVYRIPTLFCFYLFKNIMAFPWRPYTYIEKIVNDYQPEVIHIHHPFLLGSIAVSIAQKKNIKTIFTYHTQYHKYAHYIPLPRFITVYIIEYLVIRFARKVDEIVAPSRAIREYLVSKKLDRITIVPSAIDDQFLGYPFFKKKVHNPISLLYVGRFVKEKNIPALFDCMRFLPDHYQLTLVGFGSYQEYLEKYAYKYYGFSLSRVRFISNLERQQIIEYYKKAHLFLFPSQSDTQGLVLAEAMALSTPIIALDGAGQQDCIRNGYNGFIISSAEQMAEYTQKVMKDPMQYHELQYHAWQESKKYNGDSLAKKIGLLYAED